MFLIRYEKNPKQIIKCKDKNLYSLQRSEYLKKIVSLHRF
ncbi:hypothetical protein Bache_3051 [Bacteroides helcogenes P 36-108]|uniref:Uncharacterized protein n=1 Tax=Bacteroides helcogenes (strain ATCC 35417 / DSM 20613 / JCM 6297 / CCUG 15421 / P 36-108) TaxID=693979 RepID=E6SQD3_BACT6|nr:hypothetical protein Bache_3051 [Bacteroides helcogenes P 36-108]